MSPHAVSDSGLRRQPSVIRSLSSLVIGCIVALSTVAFVIAAS